MQQWSDVDQGRWMTTTHYGPATLGMAWHSVHGPGKKMDRQNPLQEAQEDTFRNGNGQTPRLFEVFFFFLRGSCQTARWTQRGGSEQLLQVPTSVAAVQQLRPEEGHLQLEDNANRDTASYATALLVEDFHCSIFRFTFNLLAFLSYSALPCWLYPT